MLKLNLTDNLVYSVVLPLSSGGRSLRMEMDYNRWGDFWSMSLYDPIAEKYLTSRTPLLLAMNDEVIVNVLKQMNYLGLGEFLLISKENTALLKNPNYWRIAEKFNLYWGE